MTTHREPIRTVHDMTIFVEPAVGQTTAPAVNQRPVYAKVREYAPPVVTQLFKSGTQSGIGSIQVPEGFEIADFTITLDDYSIEPERLQDGKYHHFRSREAITGPPGAGQPALVPMLAQYHAAVVSVNRGTVSRLGDVPPVILTLRPIEVWRLAPLATVTEALFTGDTLPETNPEYHAFRLNIHKEIWWVDGKDMLRERAIALGRIASS